MAYSLVTTSKAAAMMVLAVALSACSSRNKAEDNNVVVDETLQDSELSLEDALKEETSGEESQELSEEAKSDIESKQGIETSASQSASSGKYAGSTRPTVQSEPFEKDGFLMNAFYFVQSDQETYSSLSQLFYGRPERAEMIASWNSNKALKAGTVVYYNSHFRFKDAQRMLPFYEDYNFSWNSYQVKAGDSLSAIGKHLYNNVNTWRNLAAYNPEISNPDVLEIGQTLRLPPLEVDTEAQRQASIAGHSTQDSSSPTSSSDEQSGAVVPPSQETLDQAASVQPVQKGSLDQSEQADLDSKEATAPPADKKGLANIEDGLSSATNKLKQDQKMMYLGGALIALSILLIILRRRSAKAKA